MQKTTVYLPDDLKLTMGRLAKARSVSEAELIREALRSLVATADAPRPRLPLFSSGRPRLAEQVEDALAGFGEA